MADDLAAAADPVMFPHLDGTRYFIAGQANIIFQAHAPFHSPYEGVNSLLGRGEYKTSLVGTLFLGAELLRDPSHVHALSREEFSNLFLSPELEPALFAEYRVEMSLDSQLAASFPVPGGAERIRKLLQNDVGVDRCGVSAHWVGSELHYAVPIVVGAAHKRV